MKQIEEIEHQSAAKVFQTPKKKDKLFKKPFQSGHDDQQPMLSAQSMEKFDLGQSPRFMGATQMQSKGQNTFKQRISCSSKKPYSPIIIKVQENSFLSSFKNKQHTRHALVQSYGDLRVDENFSKCYDDIIKKLEQNYRVQIPLGQIIEDQDNDSPYMYSQLLTFQLNRKNSRNLVYDQKKYRVVPTYPCLGCGTMFEKASSLGGHLSRCKKKQLHHKKLKVGSHKFNQFNGMAKNSQIKQEESQYFQEEDDESKQKIDQTMNKEGCRLATKQEGLQIFKRCSFTKKQEKPVLFYSSQSNDGVASEFQKQMQQNPRQKSKMSKKVPKQRTQSDKMIRSPIFKRFRPQSESQKPGLERKSKLILKDNNKRDQLRRKKIKNKNSQAK